MWPKTREQRDWFHKLGNILDKLPKRLQPRVKAALHEVMYAETRAQARLAITGFATEYGAKYPKAVSTLENDADVLLTFFDFRAEHCPGVAAATWGAIPTYDLRPICITGTKFYGTWGDPEPLRDALLEWLAGRDDMWHEVQQVAGYGLIRITGQKAKEPKQPVSKYAGEKPEPVVEAPKPAAKPAPAPRATTRPATVAAAQRRPSRTRRIAKDLLPPIITRALVKARKG